MTIEQIESYYGKEAADRLRVKIANGMYKLPTIVRLENPKYKRGFLKLSDVIVCNEYGVVRLPNNVRYSDVVRIEG